MSASEKAQVKAAVAAYLEEPGTPDRLSPGDVAATVEARTGLNFGATTIAKYMKGCGWTRGEPERGAVLYQRPTD